MSITSVLPIVLLAAAGSPTHMQPITAEQALKRYRERFTTVQEMDCPRASGDIVVCGRSGRDPNRSPLPYSPQPGDRVRLLPGEPPSASAALGADRMCFHDCPEPPKGGILNVVKGVAHILGKDE
jgi:hypothetical protein